jgi:putative heme-binding domain-containing protein
VVWALRPKTAIPDLIATVNNAARPVDERERALDALINMEWPEATRAVETFILSGPTTPELARLAFAGYSRQLFSLWPDARNGADLARLVRKGLATTASQEAAVDLIGRLLDPQFLPDLRALARLDTANPAARAAAVSLIASTNDNQYVADLKALGESGPAPVRVAAVRGIGALPNPDIAWAQGILLSDAPNDVRVEALRAMAGSTAGLGALLDLAEKGQLPAEFRSLASNLTNTAGRGARGGGARGRGGFAAVLARGAGPGPAARGGAAPPAAAGAGAGRGAPAPDPALELIRERAAKVLPLPASTAAPIPGIAALERNFRGNAEAGRRVFEIDGACAACHSLGGARKIGPDLSNIGLKYGKQAMLDHIIRPNDAIGLEYVTSTIELRGGETVSGIVTETTPDRIVVRVGETEERRLRPTDVVSRRQSGLSMMPEGLLSALSLQQVSDLLEFLATRR